MNVQQAVNTLATLVQARATHWESSKESYGATSKINDVIEALATQIAVAINAGTNEVLLSNTAHPEGSDTPL